MNDYDLIQVYFCTRNCCVVKIPKNLKEREDIEDFLYNAIPASDFENFVDGYVDYEITELEILE